MSIVRPTPPFDSLHFHFVTGRLANAAVKDVVESLAIKHRFAYSIQVVPISVAALITPRWLLRHVQPDHGVTHVVLPGYCDLDAGDPLVKRLADQNIDVVVGPTDCRMMPEIFGDKLNNADLTSHDIEIIAEINHAPRLGLEQVIATAKMFIRDGADRIDLGCDPQRRCLQIADHVKAVKDLGVRVSIDSFDANEVTDATSAGADLVLSINASNRHQAMDLGCEVVAIPDSPTQLDTLGQTVEFLDRHGIAFRADPILEPIGSGFAASLVRFDTFRQRYPDAAMMMGIGNLTELTDVDSAGINFILLGICEELSIRSVLTTQVINWARSSIRECEIARRLVHYAVNNGVPPKRLSDELVMLRDRSLTPYSSQVLDDIAQSIRDNNYRLFVQDATLRLISAGVDLSDDDPFRLFERLMQQPQSDNIDPAHAFYLGYEMSKAMTALHLGKQYNQDQSLDWGFLTVKEDMHRIARTSRNRTQRRRNVHEPSVFETPDSKTRNSKTPNRAGENPSAPNAGELPRDRPNPRSQQPGDTNPDQ